MLIFCRLQKMKLTLTKRNRHSLIVLTMKYSMTMTSITSYFENL